MAHIGAIFSRFAKSGLSEMFSRASSFLDGSASSSMEPIRQSVRDDFQRINKMLPRIEAVLEDAEERELQDRSVTTPLLKFMAEFVLNKAQRLTFDSSSPNGILLFREVSKFIVAYGSRILSLPNGSDMYANKYKGIWISLTILSRALFGNYVNFGAFAKGLDIALKKTLSVPLVDESQWINSNASQSASTS